MIKFNLQRRLKAAGGELALHVEGQFEAGQLLALYGDSGVGKTSILRMLAGLMDCERGRIEVQGECWLDTEKGIDWPPRRRQVGLVFQDYALFPNMTVRENLRFALSKGQPVAIVEELVEMMELGELQGRRPGRLSGGQQQRVALARALVRRPSLLLLDEPLSALDQGMRSKLQDYVLRVHREYGLTTILVSHDVGEVCRMADRVWILEEGKVVRWGSPLELFAGARSGSERALQGEVLRIEGEERIWVLVGDQIIQLWVAAEELANLQVGDRVLLDTLNFTAP
ncbi:MAG: ATP-binding cassette domain-containing protein [Bacteroidota bacterium]